MPLPRIGIPITGPFSQELNVTYKKLTLPALALLAALGGGFAALPAHDAAAQAANPGAQAAPARPERPSHIEGRIAYLKAELKITPAQEAQWNQVAQAMRQNDQERRQSFEQLRGNRNQPIAAPDRLAERARLATQRARADERLLNAFRPLYASFSDEQKKAADAMLMPHHHRGFRR
jgi:hypothetical protein